MPALDGLSGSGAASLRVWGDEVRGVVVLLVDKTGDECGGLT